jgi:immunity protein 53 of polymorphic toxin system
MSIVEWLQAWYQRSCNGVWKHSYGIKIETLDNPGWHVQIDLTSSVLENAELEMKSETTDDDWLVCSIHDRQFHGYGDPGKLERIFEIFKEWIGNSTTQTSALADG